MRVEWTDEFDHWLTRVESRAESGDVLARTQLDYIAAELSYLRNITRPPGRHDETAQLKRVRQHGRHEVWRVSHRYDPLVAVRLIVWFPPSGDTVVVTVFAGDKKRIGDAFYDSVGTRADAAVDRWLMGHDTTIDETNGEGNGYGIEG